VTEDGEGYDYTDEELAEMTAWVEPALQELRDERALTADALALVSQVAAREPLADDAVVSWCVYCDGQAPKPWEYVSDTNPMQHTADCLWLACRRLTERATALGERTPQCAPERTTAPLRAEGSE
jgi:hypothetical protein